MPIATIKSRRDPRHGFTLHEIDLGNWLNQEHSVRSREGKAPLDILAMSTVHEPELITSYLIYR